MLIKAQWGQGIDAPNLILKTMGKISHYYHEKCSTIANFFMDYTSGNLEGKATKDYKDYDIAKGDEFNVFIEYANPEDMFYVEGSCQSLNHRFFFSEESEESLDDCLVFLNTIKGDITTDLNPDPSHRKPYQSPVMTIEGSISYVKGELYEYKRDNRITILCQYESTEKDRAVVVFEYEQISREEADQMHEDYLHSSQYDHDCKNEQWDWLKNEC